MKLIYLSKEEIETKKYGAKFDPREEEEDLHRNASSPWVSAITSKKGQVVVRKLVGREKGGPGRKHTQFQIISAQYRWA